MLEAKDQGHKRKKKGLNKNFSGDLQKKSFQKNVLCDLQKKTSAKFFSGAPQTFNNSKNTAVLEPRTG